MKVSNIFLVLGFTFFATVLFAQDTLQIITIDQLTQNYYTLYGTIITIFGFLLKKFPDLQKYDSGLKIGVFAIVVGSLFFVFAKEDVFNLLMSYGFVTLLYQVILKPLGVNLDFLFDLIKKRKA